MGDSFLPCLIGQMVGVSRPEADAVDENIEAVGARRRDRCIGGAADVARIFRQRLLCRAEVYQGLGELDRVPLAIFVCPGVKEAIHRSEWYGQVRANGNPQQERESGFVLVYPATLDGYIRAPGGGQFFSYHRDKCTVRECARLILSVHSKSPVGAAVKGPFPSHRALNDVFQSDQSAPREVDPMVRSAPIRGSCPTDALFREIATDTQPNTIVLI